MRGRKKKMAIVKKIFKQFYADDCALSALQSDDHVNVRVNKKSYTFLPRKHTSVGIIYYPGGRVQTQAFARAAHQFAQAGCFVSLEIMPLGLPMLDVDRALKTKEKYKDIRTWILAGFSLGGVTAILHTKKHPKDYAGLVLYGSYPSEKLDISNAEIKVLQIVGELDGLSTMDKVESTCKYLPVNTQVRVIDGGNHVQFAEYNKGQHYEPDNPATISRDAQQNILVTETLAFVKRIS